MPPRKSNSTTETKVDVKAASNEDKKATKKSTEKTEENKTKSKSEKVKVEKAKVEKVKGPKKPVVRKEKPSKENIVCDLATLVEAVAQEIQRNREEKNPGNKFLSSHHKLLKTFQKRLLPVIKCKTKRNVSADSGLGAPVQISPELAAFMGTDPDKPVSRLAASSFVSNYIKTNNLYNKEKQLIVPNAKLQSLFGPMKSSTNLNTLETVTGKKDGAFKWIGQLQKLMKYHFPVVVKK